VSKIVERHIPHQVVSRVIINNWEGETCGVAAGLCSFGREGAKESIFND
jgi:hypothetical protein